MFDGKVPHWHHFSCFWQRAAAQTTADIGGYSDLRWEDQEKVKKAIESGGAVSGQLTCILGTFQYILDTLYCMFYANYGPLE